jgi:PAS domain S-box-containing protein
MAGRSPTPGDSLRASLDAEHAKILARAFDPVKGALTDREFATRYLALVRRLAMLPREQLLALRVISDLPDRPPARPAAGSTPAGTESIEELLLFRRVADASGYGFSLADARGAIVYANHALCAMYGEADAGSAAGRHLSDYVPDALRADFESNILPGAMQHGPWVGELPILSRQGALTPTIQNIFVVHGDPHGTPHIASLVLDISQRKRVEDALRHSEENFRTLVENAHDGILIAAGQDRLVYANQRAAALTGYLVPQLCQMGFRELAHPDEALRLAEAYAARLLNGSGPPTYETRLLRKDGTELPVEVTAARTRWEGAPADIAFVRDITLRRLAQQALRQSEKMYRDLVENIDDVIYATDGEGYLTYLSPAIEAVTGYTPAEATGLHFSRFIFADDLPMIAERIQRILSGEHLGPIAWRAVRKSGELRWARSSSRPLVVDGHVVGVRGVISDIHELKTTQESLRESEMRYDTLLEQARVGVAIVQDGMIIYINRYCAEMIGYTPDEIIGQSLTRFLDPDNREEQLAFHERRMRGEVAPQTYRARGRRRNGMPILVDNTATVIQHKGRPAALVVIRDITPAASAEGEDA